MAAIPVGFLSGLPGTVRESCAYGTCKSGPASGKRKLQERSQKADQGNSGHEPDNFLEDHTAAAGGEESGFRDKTLKISIGRFL